MSSSTEKLPDLSVYCTADKTPEPTPPEKSEPINPSDNKKREGFKVSEATIGKARKAFEGL